MPDSIHTSRRRDSLAQAALTTSDTVSVAGREACNMLTTWLVLLGNSYRVRVGALSAAGHNVTGVVIDGCNPEGLRRRRGLPFST